MATVQPTASSSLSMDDQWLIEALRGGDEAAFIALVGRYHTSLLRLTSIYVQDQAVAEEIVQETWLGVLQGLSRFEARSSLKTWIFRILVNRASTRAVREGRSVPFSAMRNPGMERAGRGAVPGSRAVARALGLVPTGLCGGAGRAPPGRGNHHAYQGGDRSAAANPAGGHHPARRRWVDVGGSV